MSELLYRLGQFSARRAWTVIIAWVMALGLSVGVALTAGGTFTSAMTIDGLPATGRIRVGLRLGLVVAVGRHQATGAALGPVCVVWSPWGPGTDVQPAGC